MSPPPSKSTTTTQTQCNIYPPRQNQSIMTSESFTDEEDEYEGNWITPESESRSDNNKKTRKEMIEDMVMKEELEEESLMSKSSDDISGAQRRRKQQAEQNKKERLEQQRTAELAEKLGVTITMLDAPEDDDFDEESEDDASTKAVELNLPSYADQNGKKWHKQVDKELEYDSGEVDYEPSVVDGKLIVPEAPPQTQTTTTKKSIQLQKEPKKAGILVGSAGGWSLEVFPGDFVVHRKYGIGRYEKTTLKPKRKLSEEEIKAQSIRRQELVREFRKSFANENKSEEEEERLLKEKVKTFGTEADLDPVSNPQIPVLEIAYSDSLVHVPLERAYRLSRYRAGDAAVKPRLSRVKGEAWNKAKRKVMMSTAQLAQDVLALYATRETLQRTPFSPQYEKVEMQKFSDGFEFEPTVDQHSCFEAVENDMVWRKRPMDRLICGDVGFGKTEVAMRAMYRAFVNNRQATLLSPTGVLAAQHYKNLCIRMEPFGVKIGLLRGGMGKNTKVGRKLREDIKNGDIDVVVGTHALLSASLEFNDLGLLVVDEEQRFGVKQKERLKLICSGIDVLTLTATPIPRTLQMSLSGIRDTSTIRTPPPMRKPTITTVDEFTPRIVKEAIQRELDRGGQCFYVVPRISMLEEAADTIKELFPDIDIIMAHGRMPRQGAEENVALFAEGNASVLLATTVIENGVDIPSVNTIIIQNAQNFGMSTLYQLRGRVGRSNQQGYAYFLHREDSLTEQSAARLQALSDLQSLGSGFDVANRDLEIRGAGSVLGTEQSGMAARVGFDLYMRMLKKSVRQLRRLDLPSVVRTNVILPYGEGSLEASNSFSIPESFIEDDSTRVEQEGNARLAESTEKLVELTQQWKENYGPLPAKLQAKLKTLHLHACTRRLGIDLVGAIKSETGTRDCILRSPSIRPRHWARICKTLPKKMAPPGLDLIVPARFSPTGEEFVIQGGKKYNWDQILEFDEKEDEDEWDTADQEEVEAMKEITSAMKIEKMEPGYVEDYPRFVIQDLGGTHKRGARVDAILKLLLGPTKVVAKNQKEDSEKAITASELRDKREKMKQKRKEEEAAEKLKNGYFY